MKKILKSMFCDIFFIFKKFYQEVIYERYRKKYQINQSFKFNGEGILMYGDGKIIIGANSHVGRFSQIQSDKGCKVQIGKNCIISHFVKIYTSNPIANQDFSKKKLKMVRGDVAIGDNCWIGAGVFIKEGVKIGKNSIVGANSVVTKDVPPNVVVVGCPARIIKTKNSP